MRIICKKLGNVKSISLNTEYDVISHTNNRYTIINDKGIEKNYCKSLFNEINEEPAPLRQPRVVEPIVIPRRQFNELDIIVNIELDDDEDDIEIELKATGIDDYRFIRNTRLQISKTTISCGIDMLYNLSGLLSDITTFKTGLFNNLRNLENTDINISENDVNCSEILKAILNEIIEFEVGDENNRKSPVGLYILSINLNNTSLTPEYTNVLDEISVSTVETHNPNSGNRIKMWTLQLTE